MVTQVDYSLTLSYLATIGKESTGILVKKAHKKKKILASSLHQNTTVFIQKVHIWTEKIIKQNISNAQ